MSYEFYKVIHLLGLMALFCGFGGVLVSAFAGISLSGKAKKMALATHGVGLLLIVISGFGMAARMGYMAKLPGWIHAKIAIWVILGVAVALARRKGKIGWPIAILLLGLGMTAAYLAVNKPF